MDLYKEAALPEGLGFKLAMDLQAMTNFIHLSEEKKEELVQYVQGSSSGEEARYRVNEVVRNLHDNVVK